LRECTVGVAVSAAGVPTSFVVLAQPPPIGESASDVDALDRPLEALARLPVPGGSSSCSLTSATFAAVTTPMG
jgi:hypothetical protein